MGHSVDAGGSGQPLWSVHHHICIHDCHLWHQLIVSQRILHAGLLIGDNRKGSNFRTGTGGGRNCYKVGLLAHLGEAVNALADVNEAHSHILEVCIGMLIQNPHDFTGVHSRTAADGDDQIRLEGTHGLCAFSCTGQSWIGSNIVERSVGDTHSIQFFLNRFGIAVLIQERVSYNECFLLAGQLIHSYGQAALLKVNLFGSTEPQHIFPPSCNCLYVHKMADTYILGNRVAAPAAAAQSQGGSQPEIVQVANTALGRGSIYQDTACLHLLREQIELIGGGTGAEVNCCSMAITTVLQQTLCLFYSFLEGLYPVHSQHGR